MFASVGSGGQRTLSAEELSRDVEGLAADHNDLLAVQELLGHDAGEAAKEMALAIDDDLFEKTVSALLASKHSSPSATPPVRLPPRGEPPSPMPPDQNIGGRPSRLASGTLQVETHNRLETRHR